MKKNQKSTRIKYSTSDKILQAVVYTVVILLLIVILYPLVYVVSSSFSSGKAVSNGSVLLWPVDFSLEGYKTVFAYKQIWVGYANTIFYTVVGTCLNLVLTIMTAYPLSRRNFQGKGFYMTIFMITMFVSGGIIPNYILMTQLKLTNTRWALILSGALSVYNMNIMRTFFQSSIPGDLLDAAKIDGITDIGYLFKIVLPLSKAILAVITLYYAVAHWNSYFSAMLYLRNATMEPLQTVLRSILIAGKLDLSNITDPEILEKMTGLQDLMRYGIIVVSSVPMLVAYPFVQKFFEKGVMIGSVKG